MIHSVRAHTPFGPAKRRFSPILEEKRKAMTPNPLFPTFWIGIMSDKSLPRPLRLFAVVIVHSCPSSRDAECAISVLNRMVSALMNRMSWGNIRMHLIGAEDLNLVGYPYDEVGSTWGANRRART